MWRLPSSRTRRIVGGRTVAERPPVELVLELAGAFGGTVLSREQDAAAIIARAQVYSGDVSEFKLRVEAVRSREVRVREMEPRSLPSFCPDRHINLDGSFCLYATDVEPLEVHDAAGAREWWRTLQSFLQQQVVAQECGRWMGQALAHGDAARHQIAAEMLAARLGAGMAGAVARGAVFVRTQRWRGRQWLQLRCDSSVLAEVENRLGARVSKLTPCVCDDASGRPHVVSRCGRARLILTDLIHELHKKRRSEDEFVKDLRARGIGCCESLAVCSVRARAPKQGTGEAARPRV